MYDDILGSTYSVSHSIFQGRGQWQWLARVQRVDFRMEEEVASGLLLHLILSEDAERSGWT